MSRWERYLSKEIGIEFKACLYFFAFLFFYCMVEICKGNFQASMLIMAEMIFTNYAMGYVQVFLMDNFDEAEQLGAKEIVCMSICIGLYTAISYLGNWFGRSPVVTLIFVAYLILLYVCVYLVYKLKRKIDTRQLNHMLADFKNAEKSSK